VDQLLVLLPSNSKLRDEGKIQHWHSGGGIVGIQITLESGAHLFGTLEQDGDRQQWTGFDFNAPDGEDSWYIAYLEIQVRPIGQPDEATPNQFAEAIVKLLKHVR
jgi:hypothetical protein